MSQTDARNAFYLLMPPYDALIHSTGRLLPTAEPNPPRGVALVWDLSVRAPRTAAQSVAERPGGIALIVVLPPANELGPDSGLLEIVERCRPQSILPFHPTLDAHDLALVLRRQPVDLPVEFTDYLAWRGIRLDGDTRHIIRRTVDLSDHVRTVTGLARAVYLSRRALGRRFLSRGLPVPSHWLHFARVLRAAIRLQNGSDSLFTVACDLGYPDGFALSNQMMRLVGIRPSTARSCLGWEWILESWLQREVAEGSLKVPLRNTDATNDTRATAPIAESGASPGQQWNVPARRRSDVRLPTA